MSTIYNINPNHSSIVTYNRLEPVVTALEMEETMGAQVHDALWMLTQQFRVGEFKGTDGGSAIKAKIKIQSNPIQKYAANNPDPNLTVKEFTNMVPLNALIEAIDFEPDLLVRLQTGKHWFKIMKEFVIDTNDYGTIKTLMLGTSSILIESTPTTDYVSLSDKKLQQLLKVASGKIDGAKLYADLKPKVVANQDTGFQGTSNSNINLNKAALAFISYIERLYLKNSDEAWNANSLEYKYKIASHDGNAETVLIGDNYQSGHIQWYDMDIESNATSMNSPTTGFQEYTEEFIPTPVEFRGMPVDRWWELEDRNIDYASMLTGTNDLSKLMIMEFSLIYSNDWFVIPKTLDIGTLNTVDALVVTDVFGKHTLVKPSGTGASNSWQKWAMFTLNKRGIQADPDDNRLFIPPSVVTNIESAPIEQVYFVRDEMANLVWGLEEIVPSQLYGGKRGSIAANELEKHFIDNAIYTKPTISGLIENEAELNFELMNTVPENWIPFIPAKTSDTGREIQFQRAKMPRKIEGFVTSDFVAPRSQLLTSQSPYYIHEEEVIRPGAAVKATFQRARWTNGEVYTWLGYTKTNGRGEANSGLEFDRLVPKE